MDTFNTPSKLEKIVGRDATVDSGNRILVEDINIVLLQCAQSAGSLTSMIATETYSWNKSQKLDMVSLKAALAVVTSRTARIDGLLGMFEEAQRKKKNTIGMPQDSDSFNVSPDLDGAGSSALHNAKAATAPCSPGVITDGEEKVETMRPRKFDDGGFTCIGNSPDAWSGVESDLPDEEEKGPVWNDGGFGQLDESDAQSATDPDQPEERGEALVWDDGGFGCNDDECTVQSPANKEDDLVWDDGGFDVPSDAIDAVPETESELTPATHASKKAKKVAKAESPDWTMGDLGDHCATASPTSGDLSQKGKKTHSCYKDGGITKQQLRDAFDMMLSMNHDLPRIASVATEGTDQVHCVVNGHSESPPVMKSSRKHKKMPKKTAEELQDCEDRITTPLSPQWTVSAQSTSPPAAKSPKKSKKEAKVLSGWIDNTLIGLDLVDELTDADTAPLSGTDADLPCGKPSAVPDPWVWPPVTKPSKKGKKKNEKLCTGWVNSNGRSASGE